MFVGIHFFRNMLCGASVAFVCVFLIVQQEQNCYIGGHFGLVYYLQINNSLQK